MLTAISPQAFLYLWLIMLLTTIIATIILLFHWWKYLESKVFFFGVSLVYFVGLTLLILTSIATVHAFFK